MNQHVFPAHQGMLSLTEKLPQYKLIGIEKEGWGSSLGWIYINQVLSPKSLILLSSVSATHTSEKVGLLRLSPSPSLLFYKHYLCILSSMLQLLVKVQAVGRYNFLFSNSKSRPDVWHSKCVTYMNQDKTLTPGWIGTNRQASTSVSLSGSWPVSSL